MKVDFNKWRDEDESDDDGDVDPYEDGLQNVSKHFNNCYNMIINFIILQLMQRMDVGGGVNGSQFDPGVSTQDSS